MKSLAKLAVIFAAAAVTAGCGSSQSQRVDAKTKNAADIKAYSEAGIVVDKTGPIRFVADFREETLCKVGVIVEGFNLINFQTCTKFSEIKDSQDSLKVVQLRQYYKPQ